MEGGQLFLLEFLVDKVFIPTIRAIHEEILPVRTCVSFQILNLPPLKIYQETPDAECCACVESGSQIFRKGKSCLFALPEAVLQKPLCSFPITMTVYKELPPGVLPDVMLIGSRQIQIRDLVNELLCQEVFQTGDASGTIKDTFKITTATKQCVGEVTVLIRASCFGRKIVTQFQIPREKNSYLFKGADDGPVYQCTRVTAASDRERVECACSAKKIGRDGSGEAIRTCCPVPSVTDKRRPKGRQKIVRRDECPPCCRAAARDTGETVRKCGCVIKQKQTCCCIRPTSNVR